MRILVTNDDGIDSVGLHVLTRAMCSLRGDHEVVVVAPDTEYSGAGAALGALHEIHPVVTKTSIPDCDAEAWTVSGPPGLCVMFTRLGAFGGDFDLIVSGINPGANVGRSVYHSGTIGACLTGRNGHVSGIAVSQEVSGWSVEGQAWAELIENQHWETAAECARVMAQALVDDMPTETVVVNLNVPDLPLADLEGWRYTEVGLRPPRTVAEATLNPIEGKVDTYEVSMSWGEKVDLDPATDAGAVEHGYVSVSHLSRIDHEERPDVAHAAKALTALVDHA